MKQKIENLLLNLVHVRTEMCWLLLNNIIETCDRVLVTTLFRIRIPHAEENNIDGRYPSDIIMELSAFYISTRGVRSKGGI